MGTKLQRNPNTLKLMRSSVSGKLMRALQSVCTPEYYTGDMECTDCFAAGETPRYVDAIISGIESCANPGTYPWDGTYCLEKDDTQGVGRDCDWNKTINTDEGWYIIAWYLFAGTMRVLIRNTFDDDDAFYKTAAPCTTFFENSFTDCGAFEDGKNGTVRILNPFD